MDVILFRSLASRLLEGLGCSVAKATAMISGASGRHQCLASELVKRRELRCKGGGGYVWAWLSSMLVDPCRMIPASGRSLLLNVCYLLAYIFLSQIWKKVYIYILEEQFFFPSYCQCRTFKLRNEKSYLTVSRGPGKGLRVCFGHTITTQRLQIWKLHLSIGYF